MGDEIMENDIPAGAVMIMIIAALVAGFLIAAMFLPPQPYSICRVIATQFGYERNYDRGRCLLLSVDGWLDIDDMQLVPKMEALR